LSGWLAGCLADIKKVAGKQASRQAGKQAERQILSKKAEKCCVFKYILKIQ